jgi:hypothetical protein
VAYDLKRLRILSIVGPTLLSGLPAKLLDKQLGEIPTLEERAGALEVEGHFSGMMEYE